MESPSAFSSMSDLPSFSRDDIRYAAEMTRRHNDANVLALSAHSLSDEQTDRIVETWFATQFEGDRPGQERHKRRIAKIAAYEKG